MKNIMLLFPSSPLSAKRVDEDMEDEYNKAEQTGLFEMVIFDYMKWFEEGVLRLNKVINETTCEAVYRGWMMRPDKYEQFYEALLENNIKLLTSPAQYEQCHVFKNAYNILKEDTAKTLFFPSVYGEHPPIDLNLVKDQMEKFMIKDYVKSVKGTKFPSYFTKDISREEFNDWMKVFYEYRGDLFTDGICVKEYLDLKRYGNITNEFRIFYINNEIAIAYRNSNQPDDATDMDDKLAQKYKNLDSPFYTIDFAETSDGNFKVIESGDGQVSGLPDDADVERFYRMLYQML